MTVRERRKKAGSSSALTPMLRHYLEVKQRYPDAILLYRMGDFYELFFDDAQTAAPVLEVTLTARQRGTPSEAPMCGVPHHAVEGYIGKLLRAGFKVAVCDQVEDPGQAKGLVRREVTRVVTPGTISEPELLDGKEANYLASLGWDKGAGAGAFLDVSTGDFFVVRWPTEGAAADDLTRLAPREVIVVIDSLPAAVEAWRQAARPCFSLLAGEDAPSASEATALLQGHFGVASLRGFGLEAGELALQVAAAALSYASETQRRELVHVRSLRVRHEGRFVHLDETTLRNLEVFANQQDQGRRGTLLGVMDCTATAPGGRLLREWLGQPLRHPPAIEERQDAVAELAAKGRLRASLREILSRIGDLERLLARAVFGSLTPREAAALRDALAEAPALLAELEGAVPAVLRQIAAADVVEELTVELERVLEPHPAASLRDGGVIAEGVDPELDEARSLARDGKEHLLALQSRERERTGITSLKVRFNRVFGYFIEIGRSHQDRVPEDYIRKQTLANAERYFTDELKSLEERILGAEERQQALEESLFGRLRLEIVDRAERLRTLSAAVAKLDVLVAFAETAARRRYCRPGVRAPGQPIQIEEGRHPVVEAAAGVSFVPNDTELDRERSLIVLLTGPNMGGKSTYLRQVAHIVLLAQVGSFVPAKAAEIGVVDRIFTRVGASDNLARGESTFMVEMIETANILRDATSESLVILDEVGRGTSTFDGLSLAWAIVEHLHERVQPKTLFATHYHELTELSVLLPRVVNQTMAVKEWEDQILFLHRVIRGAADKSYGLHVARLAGLPAEVLSRAGEILANLESHEYDPRGKPRIAQGSEPSSSRPDQLSLFARPEDVVVSVLQDLDVSRMTPVAALNLLETLKLRLNPGAKPPP